MLTVCVTYAAEHEEGHHMDNWKLRAMLHGDKRLAPWAKTPQVVGVAVRKQGFSQVMHFPMLHYHVRRMAMLMGTRGTLRKRYTAVGAKHVLK